MENKPYTYEDGYLPDREYTSEDIQDIPPDYDEQIYTPKELGLLRAFGHILALAHHCEEVLENRQVWTLYLTKGEGESAKKTPLIEGNSRFVNILRMTAYNMYVGDFMQSPKMKEYADDFLHTLHSDTENARQFELNELQNLWDH